MVSELTQQEIAALVARLSEAAEVALLDFEPGVWYGTAAPNKRAAGFKGWFWHWGLVEHDGPYGGGGFTHRLTQPGIQVRAYVRDHLQKGDQ